MIEVLVALGVLAIGATSVFALLATGGATNRKAISKTMSAFIADSVFAEANERFDIFTDPAGLEVTDGKFSGYPGFTYTLKLVPLDPVAQNQNSDEYLALCTVSWKRAGAPVSAAYSTVIVPRLPASERGKMISPTDPDISGQ